jgi:hypothetical protein
MASLERRKRIWYVRWYEGGVQRARSLHTESRREAESRAELPFTVQMLENQSRKLRAEAEWLEREAGKMRVRGA